MSGLGELALAQPLLVLVILAVLAASAGWMIERDRPGLGKGLRQSGYLGMLAAGLLLVGGLAHNASRSDAALLLNTRPSVQVEGTETIVPKASDGHFWVTASVNGRTADFLIDTGATYTGMARSEALNAGVRPGTDSLPMEMETANGIIRASLGRAEKLRFGNVTMRDLDVAVPEQDDDKVNVIGMNFLSRLKSWRVEGNNPILVPGSN